MDIKRPRHDDDYTLEPAVQPGCRQSKKGGIGWAGDIAHGNGAQYQVQVFPARGSAWTLDVAHPPRAVTAAERNAANAEALADAKVTTVAALSDMTRSSIDQMLFGIPDRPMERSERLEWIKKCIRDDDYISEDRLDAALERMLEEIQHGSS